MQNAPRLIFVLAAAAALAGCQQEPSDQNIAITNNAAGADIEALPPDEGSASSPEDVANADAAEANTSANSL